MLSLLMKLSNPFFNSTKLFALMTSYGSEILQINAKRVFHIYWGSSFVTGQRASLINFHYTTCYFVYLYYIIFSFPASSPMFESVPSMGVEGAQHIIGLGPLISVTLSKRVCSTWIFPLSLFYIAKCPVHGSRAHIWVWDVGTHSHIQISSQAHKGETFKSAQHWLNSTHTEINGWFQWEESTKHFWKSHPQGSVILTLLASS